MEPEEHHGENRRLYLIAAGMLVALIVAAGYIIFRYFVISIAATPEAYSLLFLAIVAGIATFFSPCSFPLMPGYLAAFGTAKDVERRVIYYGLAGAAGIVLFNLLLGAVIGLVGASFAESLAITSGVPSHVTRVLRIAIGIILILFGMIQLANLPFFTAFFHKIGRLVSPNQEKSAKSIFLYGFGYTAAGLGCAGPIMAGMIVFALSSGGFLSALLAFVIYSLTMSGLILIVSALVGFAQKKTIAKIEEATPKIKNAAAVIQLLVGIFLIYSTYNVELFRKLFFP